MARNTNNIGIFGDLDLGRGNQLHANFNWMGDTSVAAGTAISGSTVQYEIGDVVVHNDRLWVARQQNDNYEPGTDAARWHDLGDTNVLHMWANNIAYEAGNLVYRREDGDADNPALLYVALQDVAAPTSGNTNAAPETNPMAGNPAAAVWLRVGGQDVEILSTNRLISNDRMGNVAREIYPVTRALSGSTIQYTFNAGDLDKLIDELGIPGPTLPNEGDADNRSLTTSDPRLTALALNFVEFARGSTTGGTNIPFTGQPNTVILRRTDANVLEITGQGTPTGTGNRDLVINAVWTLTNPDIIAGNHVSLDIAQDSNGNAVLRISADQRALTPVAPIEIDDDDGSVSLDFDSNALEVDATDGLTVNLDDESLTAPTDASGIAVNIRADSDTEPNDLQLDGADGLHVTSYDLSTGDYSGDLTNPDEVTGSNLNLTGGRDTNRDVTILARTLAAATGTDTVGITIDRPDDTTHVLRVNAPPVATWAQTQTGTMEASTIIPLSKLPNLQLGNTHTFTSPTTGTTTEGDLRRLVARNRGGQFVDGMREPIEDGSAIAWHPGDLLVISGRDPDNENNGIFVFVGADQGTTPVFPLPTTPDYQDDANPTNVELDRAFTQNFRAVISADTEVQTTLNTYSIAQDGTRSEVSEGSLNDVEVGNQRSISDQVAHTATGENEVQFTGSGGVLTIQTASREADDVTGVGGFINHINIGGTTYRFGPTPPLPTLGLSPNLNPPEILLYRSSAQTIDYALTGRQDRTNADGSVDEDVDISNTIMGAVFGASDLGDVRGSGRTFATDTGVFTIPESASTTSLIVTPGTITFGTSGGDLVGTPTSLSATPITHIYSGPNSGTGTRTEQNSEAYNAGTTIAWERDSATQFTITVNGTDAARLQADIIDTFDDAHAGFYIATTGDTSIRIPTGGGTFTADEGTPFDDGEEVPALFELGTSNTAAGSGITARNAVGTPMPTVTDQPLTAWFTTNTGVTGLRTRVTRVNDDYTDTTVSWSTPGNNSLILTIAGTDAARAATDMITILGGEHDGIFLNVAAGNAFSIQNDPINNAFPGHIDDVPEERVAYRAPRQTVAFENVQTDRTTVLNITGNANHIPDASIPSIIYDGTNSATGIANATSRITWRDARVAPSSNDPSSSFITVFTSTAPTVSFNNVDPDDATITRGRAYDVAGWTLGASTGISAITTPRTNSYAFPITAAAYGTALTSSTSTTSSVQRTATFSYPMVDTPRNLQPDTNPSNTSESVTYYRPWGYFTGTSAPTVTDVAGAPRFGTNTADRVFRRQGVNGLRITGNVNDIIYFLIPVGDLPSSFNVGSMLITGAEVGASFRANFVRLADDLTVPTAVSGTNITYAVLQSGQLASASLTVNLTIS